MLICKYKFNPNIVEGKTINLIPKLSTTISYQIEDINNNDGTITRTLSCSDEDFSKITYIRFGSNLDTYVEGDEIALLEVLDINLSNINTFYRMFRECRNLTQLDVSNWDTSKVTNMSYMFQNCLSLTQLDLSKLDTSKVATMNAMFYSCSQLTQLDVSNWDTSSVTNIGNMFAYCSSLTQLDVSNWDTSQVTTMSYMFNDCISLTQLDLSKWDTSQVTTMSYMFNASDNGPDMKLTTVGNLNNWVTSKVTNMDSMFGDCSSLTQLNISNWDTSKVTNMYAMFYNCSSLIQLDVSKWNTSKVTTISDMFHNCSKLTQLDVSKWDTSQVKNMSVMFHTCSSLTQLDVSKWDTSNVTNMNYMFYGCSKLTQLDVSNWDTSKVTNMSDTFNGCSKLTNIGTLYCSKSTVEFLSQQLTNKTIWVQDTKASDYTDTRNTYKDYQSNQVKISLPQPLRKLGNVSDRLYWDYDKGHYCIEKKISDDYIILSTPEIIDLPHLNEKYLLDIYEGNSYSECTNTPMQPTEVKLNSDIQRYKDDLLSPSTEYTLQFNCILKGNNPIQIKIDDTYYTIPNVEIGINHFVFTTPSSIVNKEIFLSGEGNTISEVMLMKGDVKQYPNYFEGILGVGELQEDESYGILIESNNYDYYWKEL